MLILFAFFAPSSSTLGKVPERGWLSRSGGECLCSQEFGTHVLPMRRRPGDVPRLYLRRRSGNDYPRVYNLGQFVLPPPPFAGLNMPTKRLARCFVYENYLRREMRRLFATRPS